MKKKETPRQRACCSTFGMYEPHIDHDHETGEIRGLLCKRCNMMEGLAHSPNHLRQLANYMELARACIARHSG